MLNIEQRLMIKMAPDYQHLTLIQKVEVFESLLQNTSGHDLRKALWLKSPSAELWLDRRIHFTRSLACMSMVGYILGLGDRHPCNFMLEREEGRVVHIDFGGALQHSCTRTLAWAWMGWVGAEAVERGQCGKQRTVRRCLRAASASPCLCFSSSSARFLAAAAATASAFGFVDSSAHDLFFLSASILVHCGPFQLLQIASKVREAQRSTTQRRTAQRGCEGSVSRFSLVSHLFLSLFAPLFCPLPPAQLRATARSTRRRFPSA